MNRRQLFTRLSAVALAPLVKWLPKEDTLTLVAGTGIEIFSESGVDYITIRAIPQEEA